MNGRSRYRKLAIDASGAVVWTLLGVAYLLLARLPVTWDALTLPAAGAATSMLFDMVRRWSLKDETQYVGPRFVGTMAAGALVAVASAMLAGLGAVGISMALFGGALVGLLLAFGLAVLGAP